MYKLQEVKGSAELIRNGDGSVLSIVMANDNIERQHALLRIIQENATIHHYYWVSLLDETYIEYLRPKVFDVFKMVIVATGTYEQLKTVISLFNEYMRGIEQAKQMM